MKKQMRKSCFLEVALQSVKMKYWASLHRIDNIMYRCYY